MCLLQRDIVEIQSFKKVCSNNLGLLLTMFIHLTFDIIINIFGFLSTILLFDFCLFPQLFVPLFSFSFLLLGYLNTFISPFKFIYYVLTILVFHLFVCFSGCSRD